MLNTRHMDIFEKPYWGWLPRVALIFYNVGGVVLSKNLGERLVAQGSGDFLLPIVDLLRPEGAAILEHELAQLKDGGYMDLG